MNYSFLLWKTLTRVKAMVTFRRRNTVLACDDRLCAVISFIYVIQSSGDANLTSTTFDIITLNIQ